MSNAHTDSTTDTAIASPDSQSYHQKLRKLAHDIRSPLSVLAMGIEAIRALKDDPAQLDALCDMMANEGITPIKNSLNQMVDS